LGSAIVACRVGGWSGEVLRRELYGERASECMGVEVEECVSGGGGV
jgi:hypothetical protein